jgi:hypothetical protein
MVQRNDGFNAALKQGLDNPNVMAQRTAIPYAFLGLDPAPLDRESVRIMSKRSRQVEVHLVQLEVPTRIPGLVWQASVLF